MKNKLKKSFENKKSTYFIAMIKCYLAAKLSKQILFFCTGCAEKEFAVTSQLPLLQQGTFTIRGDADTNVARLGKNERRLDWLISTKKIIIKLSIFLQTF